MSASLSLSDAIAQAIQVDANGDYVITSLQQITDIFNQLSGAAVNANAPAAFAYSGPLNIQGQTSEIVTSLAQGIEFNAIDQTSQAQFLLNSDVQKVIRCIITNEVTLQYESEGLTGGALRNAVTAGVSQGMSSYLYDPGGQSLDRKSVV